MVHWIFHYSHDKIASIESFKNKIVDHYNYGLLLIVNSDDEENRRINSMAIANLNSVAEEIRSQMMLSFCDVAVSQICRELVIMFELEDHQLPLVRMLYRASDHSKEEVGQEQIFYKFSLDRNIYKQTIEDVRDGKASDSKYLEWRLILEMLRIETDTNGNTWLEDLRPEGFKILATGYGQGKLQIDMRSEQFSKVDYNEAVLVFTPENGIFI